MTGTGPNDRPRRHAGEASRHRVIVFPFPHRRWSRQEPAPPAAVGEDAAPATLWKRENETSAATRQRRSCGSSTRYVAPSAGGQGRRSLYTTSPSGRRERRSLENRARSPQRQRRSSESRSWAATLCAAWRENPARDARRRLLRRPHAIGSHARDVPLPLRCASSTPQRARLTSKPRCAATGRPAFRPRGAGRDRRPKRRDGPGHRGHPRRRDALPRIAALRSGGPRPCAHAHRR